MLKKNHIVKYTSIMQLDKILKYKEVLFAISAIIVAVLNLWLGSKLAPVARDIDVIKHQVLANENNIISNNDQIEKLQQQIFATLNKLDERVDDIYKLLARP